MVLSFVLPVAVLLTIDADIGPSKQLNWAPTAWTLAQGVVMTIAGSLSDICGRRNFALAGNLMGLIGTMLEPLVKHGVPLTSYRLHHRVKVCLRRNTTFSWRLRG